MNKRYFLGFSGLLLSASLMGQANRHNFDVTAGGGLQSVSYSVESGETSPGFGWNATVMYRYMFNPNWGTGFGLGVSHYKSSASFDSLRISQSFVAHEHNGLPYELENDFIGWKETQRVLAFEVPVALFYQKPFNANWAFMGDLGAKLIFPVWNSYHVNDGYLSLKGYFEHQTNVEYSNLPVHGFSTYHHFYGDNKLKSVSGAAFVDLGVLRTLNAKRQLYMGGYFSYAFSNLVDNGGQPDLFDNKVYTGVLSSGRVDKAHLISAGIKVGLTFGSTNSDASAEVQPKTIWTEQEKQSEDENNAKKPAESEKSDDVKHETQNVETQDIANGNSQPADAAERARIQQMVDFLNSNLKVTFTSDNAVVSPNAENERQLDMLANYISQNPNKIVKITGHTCNLSDEDSNVMHAFMYAESFKKYLIGKGFSSMNLVTESKGSKDPLVDGNNSDSCLKNRRVVISIIHDADAE